MTIEKYKQLRTSLQPRKRTARDGKTWWCVFNTATLRWEPGFFRYRTERECSIAICLFLTA